MSKTQEALKLALEALEWINRVNAMEYEYQQKARESLNAIYEALAEQPAQPSKPWVGLTDEFLRKLHHEDQFGLFCDYDEFEQIARAIEAKLRERNT